MPPPLAMTMPFGRPPPPRLGLRARSPPPPLWRKSPPPSCRPAARCSCPNRRTGAPTVWPPAAPRAFAAAHKAAQHNVPRKGPGLLDAGPAPGAAPFLLCWFLMFHSSLLIYFPGKAGQLRPRVLARAAMSPGGSGCRTKSHGRPRPGRPASPCRQWPGHPPPRPGAAAGFGRGCTPRRTRPGTRATTSAETGLSPAWGYMPTLVALRSSAKLGLAWVENAQAASSSPYVCTDRRKPLSPRRRR